MIGNRDIKQYQLPGHGVVISADIHATERIFKIIVDNPFNQSFIFCQDQLNEVIVGRVAAFYISIPIPVTANSYFLRKAVE